MTARERVNRGRELPGPERPPDVTAYRAAMDTQARRELRAWQVQASIARIWQALAIGAAVVLSIRDGLPGLLCGAGLFWIIRAAMPPPPTDTLDDYTGRKGR